MQRQPTPFGLDRTWTKKLGTIKASGTTVGQTEGLTLPTSHYKKKRDKARQLMWLHVNIGNFVFSNMGVNPP